ncbi:MAG: hypothetical protein KBC81_00775 [Candidatus Pacebacteria bacterium]|nr:hypothetical protein [Candidatus Paceibacterota bacterium]
MLIVGIVVACLALYLRLEERKNRRYLYALQLHNDLFDKYVELTREIGSVDWDSWIPVFEYGDSIVRSHSHEEAFAPVAKKAKAFALVK